MQTDPIKLQEKTITTVVVVLLMSLCLCAEAASKYGGRQAELGSPVPFSFSLFSFDGGWSSGAERRFTPETFLPPSLGNKRGFFSEEHSDVGGGCEYGPCVRAAAAPFVCFPSPSLVPVQIYKNLCRRYIFDSLLPDGRTLLLQVCSHLQ